MKRSLAVARTLQRVGVVPRVGVFGRSEGESRSLMARVATGLETVDGRTRFLLADARIDELARLYRADKVTPPSLFLHELSHFIDADATPNFLLSRRFLSEMTAFDGFIFLTAAATDLPDDWEMLRQDLFNRDKEVIERRLLDLQRKLAKSPSSTAMKLAEDVLRRAVERLAQGQALGDCEWTEEESSCLLEVNPLTAKPVVAVGVDAAATPVAEMAVSWSGAADNLGLAEALKSAMGLATFFTAGPSEVRGWVVREGTPAAKAASVIHSDFEQRFISAEVCPTTALLEAASEEKARTSGRLRPQGKSYPIVDGDVVTFRLGPKKGGRG